MTEQPEPTDAEPAPTPDERVSRRYRDRGVNTTGIVWGAILLAIGGWFFLRETLGFELPSIDWGSIWPVILIVVGAVVIYQAMRKRT